MRACSSYFLSLNSGFILIQFFLGKRIICTLNTECIRNIFRPLIFLYDFQEYTYHISNTFVFRMLTIRVCVCFLFFFFSQTIVIRPTFKAIRVWYWTVLCIYDVFFF